MSAHRIFWLCCLKTGAKPFAELPNFHTVDYLNCICKSCHVEFLFCVSVSVLSLCLMHTCYSWTRFPFEKEILISNVRVCVSQSTSGSSLIATVKLQLREKKEKKECIYRLCTPTPQWPGCKYGSFALFTQCIPLWTVWQWCVTNAGNVSDMFLSQLYNMHVNTFISHRLHLASCVCVFVCAITQENICQTAAVSHPQLKHTQWSCSHVSSMQNKPHYQQHHDEASAFSDVQTQKMSGSPLSQNTDSGLFPARCADLRSQNKREPCLGKEKGKKNCITKTMISVILHAYLSENQNPLQSIILRVSEDVGLCAGALLYICACLCWWLFMHIQAFM